MVKDQLNELAVNPETTLPSNTNVFSFLSNTINNQTFYYLSGINCFADENTNLASNSLELRALVLDPSILKQLRKIGKHRIDKANFELQIDTKFLKL
jgi:hypothetical protein